MSTTIEYVEKALALLERIAVAVEHGAVTQRDRVGAQPATVSPVVGSNPASSTTSSSSIAEPTYDKVKKAVFAYQDKHGQPAAITLLKEFGAKYISELKPEQYAGVMAKLA
jgi:hypothetical protein